MSKQAALADKLLEIGIALSSEKNPNQLLRTILDAAILQRGNYRNHRLLRPGYVYGD